MKNGRNMKIIAAVFGVCLVGFLAFNFMKEISFVFAKAALVSASRLLPSAAKDNESEPSVGNQTEQTEQSQKDPSETVPITDSAAGDDDFYAVPDDIRKRIEGASKTADKDKKDGTIFEKQYKNDGMTDSFGNVRLKNLNKTKVSVEQLLKEKADLSVSRNKPSVLIYHTHTTEAYQILDRDFYAQGYITRSKDTSFNMVRVGDEIVKELEKNGFQCIHDTEIHDVKYSGAYDHSRKAVTEYLKKYPSVQITLDIHRDAIELSDGTKIKPTATINGHKAAQVMIISGCQERGNPVEDFSDWRYNLVFAVTLQNKLETLFPGLTRPIFFAPRRYNMNLTRNSLLIEVGSDSNTLQEAALSGKMIGKALAEVMKEYTE